MDIEKVLNIKDGYCRNCADDCPAGVNVYQSKLHSELGMFCSEACLANHFELCPDCMGTGEVTTIERVYSDPGSPSAPIGTAKCHCQMNRRSNDRDYCGSED